jgi:hypothetical protein
LGTATVTLGASLIAAAGTLLAGVLQEKRARARAEAEARERRLRKAAETVARIELLREDADPDRLAINVDRDKPFAALTPCMEKWKENLRSALAVLALSNPSPEMRECGRQLRIEVGKMLTQDA